MNHKKLILSLSLLLPTAVFILYIIPKFNMETVDFLPFLNAIINGTVFFILIFAFMAIKKGKRELHKKLIYAALSLSILFLLSYVFHHATHDSVAFAGAGLVKYLYYFVLITHIILAAIIVPMVLITFSRASKEEFKTHKSIARITLPLWLYVSLTGVIVYLMISPYYPY
jgi:putative membrane protein